MSRKNGETWGTQAERTQAEGPRLREFLIYPKRFSQGRFQE
jgi:hypothetical protein